LVLLFTLTVPLLKFRSEALLLVLLFGDALQ
jgi:hypothetical protein